jgi:hypothetical protein
MASIYDKAASTIYMFEPSHRFTGRPKELIDFLEFPLDFALPAPRYYATT